MREPTFRRPQSLYETVRTIYFHHFSWSHKCLLCKHYTTFELSLIYSTLYMAFPWQPLLFTETVPHNSYETVEGNPNLLEDIEILLSIMFCWIPFSGFRGEVENVSANQRQGRPFRFSDRPEQHKLDRGHWDLASCQVSLNSVKRFQRRSRKCLSQSEVRAAILFFRSARKTHTL